MTRQPTEPDPFGPPFRNPNPMSRDRRNGDGFDEYARRYFESEDERTRDASIPLLAWPMLLAVAAAGYVADLVERVRGR